MSSNPKKAAFPVAWTPRDFETKRVSLICSFRNFTWSLPKISSWWLSNHQFGNRQICNRWPGKWWGCTLLPILPGGLAPRRVVWGWSLAFQKLTTRRPLRKESRRSGSQHKSTSLPGKGKRQRTKSRHLVETMGVGERIRQPIYTQESLSIMCSFILPVGVISYGSLRCSARRSYGNSYPIHHILSILHSRIWMYPKTRSLTL